jgi:hypothetical protein
LLLCPAKHIKVCHNVSDTVYLSALSVWTTTLSFNPCINDQWWRVSHLSKNSNYRLESPKTASGQNGCLHSENKTLFS